YLEQAPKVDVDDGVFFGEAPPKRDAYCADADAFVVPSVDAAGRVAAREDAAAQLPLAVPRVDGTDADGEDPADGGYQPRAEPWGVALASRVRRGLTFSWWAFRTMSTGSYRGAELPAERTLGDPRDNGAPQVTIAIVTQNRKDDLRAAVRSALEQEGSIEVL